MRIRNYRRTKIEFFYSVSKNPLGNWRHMAILYSPLSFYVDVLNWATNILMLLPRIGKMVGRIKILLLLPALPKLLTTLS